MIGQESSFQPRLFYHRIHLGRRIPKDHILRKIQGQIDFYFIYHEVKGFYGDNGAMTRDIRSFLDTIHFNIVRVVVDCRLRECKPTEIIGGCEI